MIMSSGFIMFVLFGLAIAIGKLIDGDKSMGCLIPIIIFTLIISCLVWVISIVTML